jgi:hypothetical protein
VSHPTVIIEMLDALRRRVAAVPASSLPTEHANDLWGEAEDHLADAIRAMKLALTDDTPAPLAYDMWVDAQHQRQDSERKSAA